MQHVIQRWAAVACAVVLFVLAAGAAHADGDKAEYERYMAQQRAKAAAAKQAEADRKAEAARNQAKAERMFVGKAAEGKSDAEVHALYEQKIADAKAQGEAGQRMLPGLQARAAEQQRQMNDPAFKAKADAGARAAGGKSMADLQNMSEADLKKLQADLEKKYGKQP